GVEVERARLVAAADDDVVDLRDPEWAVHGSTDAGARELREQRTRALDGVAVARHGERRRQEVGRARLGEAAELLAHRTLVAHHVDVCLPSDAPAVSLSA